MTLALAYGKNGNPAEPSLYHTVVNALLNTEINDGESWTHEVEIVCDGIVRFRWNCWLADTNDEAAGYRVREPQQGRWWYITDDSDESHIVRTIWLAYQTFMVHEMLERFRYKGNLVFNPHFNL